MPSKKNLSRVSLCNWCDVDADTDADADADISKTICRPPPYEGLTELFHFQENNLIQNNLVLKCQTVQKIFQ